MPIPLSLKNQLSEGVRDPQGKFLGTLEVTQDATEIRRLEGERKLLDEA